MYGDEVKFGGGECYTGSVIIRLETMVLSGKTIREGMGQATDRSGSDSLDLVITNALIVDWSGIYKARLSASPIRRVSHNEL